MPSTCGRAVRAVVNSKWCAKSMVMKHLVSGVAEISSVILNDS